MHDLSFLRMIPHRPSICYLQFRFDDGDESKSVQDYYVMHRGDYLISTGKASGDGGGGVRSEWIGVKNRVDRASIDKWAILVG